MANLKTSVSRKQNTLNLPKNEHFLPPDTHNVSGGKKCSFFGKSSVLCFLETPVLRFALLFYYRRIANDECNKNISIMISFIISHYSYCLLIFIFYNKTLKAKIINEIYHRTMKLYIIVVKIHMKSLSKKITILHHVREVLKN